MPQSDNPSSSTQVLRSPTLHHEQTHEKVERVNRLRKQLAAENETSKQLENLEMQNLPPIRTNRATMPPGFPIQVR